VILIFTPKEREADWALHLDTVKDLVHLFFAAGHVHYARYALYYLRSVERLPDGIRAKFIEGQHTTHHNAGHFNGMPWPLKLPSRGMVMDLAGSSELH